MKRKIALLLIAAAAAACALTPEAVASTSAVTATVTDTDGQVWSNGTWSAALTLPSGPFGNVTPTIGGVAVPASARGVLNANGVLSASLTDTGSLDQSGGQWAITVCPNASVTGNSGAGCYKVTLAVTGATPNLSARFSGVPAPRFPAGANAFGYLDVEVIPPSVPGSSYYNTSTDTGLHGLRLWDGKQWTGGGTSLSVQVNGTPNQLQTTLNLTGSANVATTNPSGGVVNIATPFLMPYGQTDMTNDPPMVALYGVNGFGDSNMAGAGLQSGESNFIQFINAWFNANPSLNFNNYGVSGSFCADVTNQVFTHRNPGDTENPLDVYDCGTNDTISANPNPVNQTAYAAVQMAGLAWDAMSSTNKFPSNLASRVDSFRVTAGGSGWTGFGTVGFTGGGCSVEPTAANVPEIGGAIITQVYVTLTPGIGCTSAPAITITGSGSGATATATFTPAVVQTGTWTTDTTYSTVTGQKSTTNGSSLTWPAYIYTNGIAFLWYKIEVGPHTGIFSCTVDGTTATDLVTGSSTLNTQMTAVQSLGGTSVNLAAFATPDKTSTHTLACTVTSATGASNDVTIFAQGIPPGSISRGLGDPAIVSTGVIPTQNNSLDMGTGGVLLSAVTDGYNQTNAALLQSYGLHVVFAPVRNRVNAYTDMQSLPLQNCSFSGSAGYHMDKCGHLHLAQAIASAAHIATLSSTSVNMVPGVVSWRGQLNGGATANPVSLISGFNKISPSGASFGSTLTNGVDFGYDIIGGVKQNTVSGTISASNRAMTLFTYTTVALADCWFSATAGSVTNDDQFSCPIWRTSDGVVHTTGLTASDTVSGVTGSFTNSVATGNSRLNGTPTSYYSMENNAASISGTNSPPGFMKYVGTLYNGTSSVAEEVQTRLEFGNAVNTDKDFFFMESVRGGTGTLRFHFSKDDYSSFYGLDVGSLQFNHAGTPISSQSGNGGTVVMTDSPALTGSPTAPTQTALDNSTKIATTSYADSAVAAVATGTTPAKANFVSRGRTTALTAHTVLTTAATATYRINAVANCQGAGGTSFTLTVAWTDTLSQAQSQTYSGVDCAAVASAFASTTLAINVLTGTNITVAVSLAGTPTYDIAATVEQLTAN